MLNFSTELHHVTSYLKLEQARFEERLIVELDLDEDLNCMVPSFILQPLVENAVRYGIDQKGNRYVNISAKKQKDMVVIAVTDHGPGIPAEVLKSLITGEGKGVGLINVHQRLKSIYGEAGGLQIEASAGGSCVSFCVPLTPTDTLLFSSPPIGRPKRR